jgi:hypothetical protein
MTSSGQWTLLTRLKHSYSLTDYLRRYSQEPLRFSMGISALAMVLSEKYYENLPGGLLEATGKLFANNVKIYVHPMSRNDFIEHLKTTDLDVDFVTVSGEGPVSILDIEFDLPLGLLYQYVLKAGWIVSLPHEGVISS